MHSSTILTTLLTLASFTAASPTPRDIYYGVSIHVFTSPGNDPNKIASPAPLQINNLTPINCGNTPDGEGCLVSKLSLDQAPAVNVNIDDVECRGYKDAPGVVPGSAPFNVSTPAVISSTGLGSIGSLLCYII
jgi:hypothetical protein